MLKTISIAILTGALSAGSAFAGMLNVHNPNMRFDSVSPALTELNENFVRARQAGGDRSRSQG